MHKIRCFLRHETENQPFAILLCSIVHLYTTIPFPVLQTICIAVLIRKFFYLTSNVLLLTKSSTISGILSHFSIRQVGRYSVDRWRQSGLVHVHVCCAYVLHYKVLKIKTKNVIVHV